MIEQQTSGKLVIISSTMSVCSFAGYAQYAPTKAALKCACTGRSVGLFRVAHFDGQPLPIAFAMNCSRTASLCTIFCRPR